MISAAEHDRLQALYAPLTESVRRLDRRQHPHRRRRGDRPRGAGRDRGGDATSSSASGARTTRCALRCDGRPVVWGNPADRRAQCDRTAAGHARGAGWPVRGASSSSGRRYEGPPGWVHGGICALVLDHILGEAASDGLTKPMFTGTITLRYLRGTPLGPLRAEACDRADGRRQDLRAAGYMSDAEGKTVEAEGVFIKPAWARDAG